MRLSENKVSNECETPKGKVSAIKDKFEALTKKKKGEGQVWGENKCVGKVRKHLNFYVKSSDLTHAYFSYMPMILLLYKEAYFNANKPDSYVLSICVSLL